MTGKGIRTVRAGHGEVGELTRAARLRGADRGSGHRPGARWHRRQHWSALALLLVAGSVVVAGCSSSSTSAPPTTSTPRHPTTHVPPSTTTTASTATPAVYQVQTGSVKGLGTVLVNGQGMTLYLFVPDKQSGRSTCYGPCAAAWPPLLLPTGVTAPIAGPGAKVTLLGTTHRTDGTTEVTYNRWPLYTWVNDTQPGDATGQAINSLGGLWYVVSPDGNAITTKP